MTRKLTLIFILFFPFILSAQSFINSHPNWVHKQFNFCVEADLFLSFVGDTTILGKPCKVMQKRSENFNRCTQANETRLEVVAFIHEENGVVLYYLPDSQSTAFDTLYNFKLGNGQTYSFKPNISNPLEVRATVLDKGSHPSRPSLTEWQVIQYQFDNNFSYTDTVYENVGNVGRYFFPWDPYFEQFDGQRGGNFRCFLSDLGEFDPFGLNCLALITRIEEDLTNRGGHIFFQVEGNRLVWEGEGLPLGDWGVYDLQGRQVLKASNQKTLDVSPLPAGFYVVRVGLVSSNNRGLHSLKIFKQH